MPARHSSSGGAVQSSSEGGEVNNQADLFQRLDLFNGRVTDDDIPERGEVKSQMSHIQDDLPRLPTFFSDGDDVTFVVDIDEVRQMFRGHACGHDTTYAVRTTAGVWLDLGTAQFLRAIGAGIPHSGDSLYVTVKTDGTKEVNLGGAR